MMFLWPATLPLGRSSQMVIFNESPGNKEACAVQIGASSMRHEQLRHKSSVTGLFVMNCGQNTLMVKLPPAS